MTQNLLKRKVIFFVRLFEIQSDVSCLHWYSGTSGLYSSESFGRRAIDIRLDNSYIYSNPYTNNYIYCPSIKLSNLQQDNLENTET
jgi:hypothetical protein